MTSEEPQKGFPTECGGKTAGADGAGSRSKPRETVNVDLSSEADVRRPVLVMHICGIGKNAATGQRAIITAPNSDLQL